VARALDEIAPALIINCAAFNNVDGAEDRPVDALAANAFGVRSLARGAQRHGATLVHYSTDFVFDGEATSLRRALVQAPGACCEARRRVVRLDAPRAFVLRVESLFGARRMDGAAARRRHCRGSDRGRSSGCSPIGHVSPSYVEDVAWRHAPGRRRRYTVSPLRERRACVPGSGSGPAPV
jgi:dTDP-4-dehydrorhamnose reductase